MELPVDVLAHNEILGIKGSRGVLLAISEHGFYEVNLKFGDKTHRVLLPVSSSVIIQRDPEEAAGESLDIER
jgi:hypothetical protein